MSKRIIYETDEGGVAIIVPSDDALKEHTVEEIAAKDVPSGVEYWIVSADTVPSDRTFRDAWEVDFNIGSANGVGAVSNSFK